MIEIVVKGFGSIKVVMDYKDALNTCANFVELARKGFYNGLTFHRIIKHFMIQGGDPLGTGVGGPGYGIKGEFLANGVDNRLSHKRGVISMARAQDPDSAGSQFFICDVDDGFLDGQYAAFGHIAVNDVDSFKALDKIAAVRTHKPFSDMPYEPVVIEKMVVSEDEPSNPVEKIED